jgi:hypothetical protein
MLELFLPLATNTRSSKAPSLSGHYRLLLLVGQFDELTSHRQVTNVGKVRRSLSLGEPCIELEELGTNELLGASDSNEALPSWQPLNEPHERQDTV